MKKNMIGLAIVLLGLLLVVPAGFAYQLSAGDWVKLDEGIGNAYGGGTYNVYKNNVWLFDTFCLERTEHIYGGDTYYIGSITDGAIRGGIAGGNPDPISSETAYLYYKWSIGHIEHTAANANGMQLAVWYFENEYNSVYPLPPLTAEATNFINLANGIDHNGNLYYVQVLNLYAGVDSLGNPMYNKQDQLYYVPEPSTLLFLGAGLLGLGFAVRRRKR